MEISKHQKLIKFQGDKGPQLVNLCEDPQLSETLSYCLKDGTTTLGQSSSDLVLKGLHCEDIPLVSSFRWYVCNSHLIMDLYVCTVYDNCNQYRWLFPLIRKGRRGCSPFT